MTFTSTQDTKAQHHIADPLGRTLVMDARIAAPAAQTLSSLKEMQRVGIGRRERRQRIPLSNARSSRVQFNPKRHGWRKTRSVRGGALALAILPPHTRLLSHRRRSRLAHHHLQFSLLRSSRELPLQHSTSNRYCGSVQYCSSPMVPLRRFEESSKPAERKPEDLVFRSNLGGPIHESRFVGHFKPLLRSTGLSNIRSV